MLRLWNGLGWVDTASGRYAMPPDGETFAIAPGAPAHGSRTFHVVSGPELVAVFTPGLQTPIEGRERAAIESILIDGVAHVAFIVEDRVGYALVEGRGDAIRLATAVTALKVFGGWDETVPIRVDCNGKSLEVWPSFDGWTTNEA